MKVAVLVESQVWGGLEVHTVDFVRTLQEAGHEAFVACIGTTADLFRASTSGHDIPLVSVPAPARRSLAGWLSTLRRLTADTVVLQKGTLHSGSVALEAALRLRFSRVITVEHLEPPPVPPKSSRRYLGGMLPGLGLWRLRWIYRGYARSFGPQAIVCVSDSVRDALRRQYHFPARKLVTVRNGVDLSRFRADGDVARRVRRSWGIPDGAFVFGSVRRFVHEKGLDVAIEAFARITTRDAHGGPYLVLVGEGPEQPALAELASRLGVADRVIMPGFTTRPWDVYPAFDVFVIPSRIEALGIVVAESLASGCFVIGSEVGGIPEMIRSAAIGALVPPGDVEALCKAMRAAQAMTDAQRATVRDSGRRLVADEFNSRTQYLRIASLLEGDSVRLEAATGASCA